jgi:hypothetical protein
MLNLECSIFRTSVSSLYSGLLLPDRDREQLRLDDAVQRKVLLRFSCVSLGRGK